MSDLVESHRQEIAALCRHHHVKRLDLFGSAARDDYQTGSSDIDLLVEFEQAVPAGLFDTYFSLREQLSILLASPVDLVMDAAVRNPYVRQSIEAERKSLYAA